VSRKKDKIVLTAFTLGALAAILNITLNSWESLSIEPGNLLLFLAALSLGLPGIIIAASTAIVPTLLFGGDPVWAARTFAICLSLTAFCKIFPRIPPFVLPLAMWFLVVGPLQSILALSSGSPLGSSLFDGQVLLSIWEIFAVATAGLILYVPQTWSYLKVSPKHLELRSLLPTIFTALVTSIALMILVMIPQNVRVMMTTEGALLPVVFLACCLPGLLGWWLAKQTQESSQRVLSQSYSKFGDESQTMLESDLNKQPVSKPVESKLNACHWLTEVARPDGLIYLDQHGVIKFVNPALRDLAQLHDQDLVGLKLSEVSENSFLLKQLEQLISEADDDGPLIREIKVNNLPDSLHYFRAIMEYENETTRSSNARNFLIRLEDITHKRTLEAHLIQAQKMKSLGGVVAGMAHAFNNFLTSIIGQASFAMNSKDPRAHESAFEEILKAAHRAGELVWSLLDFSEGKPSPTKKLELNSLLEQRLEFFRKFIGERYELTFSCAPRAIGVACDTNLLTQVVTDILLNAKESYGGKPGSIHISLDTEEMGSDIAKMYPWARPGTFARLVVKDTGAGMNRETMAKAFDPLFTTKVADGHSGLGLSIVFSIVRAHDGFLNVESFPEKGTTISIYLPMVELSSDQIPEQADSNLEETELQGSTDSQQPQQTILVVEDEPSVRSLVTKMLSSLGYQVQSCSNGEDALRICDQDTFDLVIVDMMMPKMSGVELLSRLKDEKKRHHALIMTGYGINNSFTDNESVIAKPFDIKTLASRVKEVLNTPRA